MYHPRLSSNSKKIQHPVIINYFIDFIVIKIAIFLLHCYKMCGNNFFLRLIATKKRLIFFMDNSFILFGGCLIKSLDSKGLGNTNEAVIDDWDRTVLRIKKAYPSIKLVIPGHRAFGDLSLLNHTMTLVKDYKQKAK